MNMPGFSAEASLFGINTGYLGEDHYRIEGNVYPANYLDQNCLRNCKQDCGSACAGTAGSGKSICIHECAHDNAQCKTTVGASFSVSRSFRYLLARLAPFALEAAPPPAVTHLAIKDFVAFQRDRVLDFRETRRA